MANSYFERTFDVLPGNRVGSQAVEDQFELVEQGFDKFPSPLQVWGEHANYGADTGAADAYVTTISATHITSYAAGMTLRVRCVNANTGASTINVNGLGLKSIVRPGGTALVAGDITAGAIVQISYNATLGKFELALNGLTQATAAGVSAAAALVSQNAAAANAASAAASYDSFDDRYLGAKATDPTLDNDGNALITGALYFNTTVGQMRAYSGAAWGAAFVVAGTVGIPYTFSTTTADADPGAGTLRLDNATQALATTIRVDLDGSDGTTYTDVLATFDDSTSTVKGVLSLQKIADPTKWIIFSVSALASPAGYRNITVAVVAASAASPFADGDGLVMKFTRTGDKGDTASGGSWVLLSPPVIANNSATVDLETTFDDTYDEFVVVIVNARSAAASGDLRCLLKVGGAYDSGANYVFRANGQSSANSTYGAGVNAPVSAKAAYIPITTGGSSTSTAGFSINAVVHISNPASTSLVKTIRAHGVAVNGSGQAVQIETFAYNTSTAAMTGIRFYDWAGDVAEGAFYLYGIKKS